MTTTTTIPAHTELMRVRAELSGYKRVLARQRAQLEARAEATALLRGALADVRGVARVLEDAAPSYAIVLHVAGEDVQKALGLLTTPPATATDGGATDG